MIRKIYSLLLVLLASSVLNDLSAQGRDSIPEEFVGLIILTDAPQYDGNLKEFIQRNVRYPVSARRDSVEGRVIVRFWIDSLGLTTRHHIVRSVREDLDNEALRVARLIKFDTPAMQYDRVIPIDWYIPVDFYLSPENNPYGKAKAVRRRRGGAK